MQTLNGNDKWRALGAEEPILSKHKRCNETCECGNPKGPHSRSCARCAFLDDGAVVDEKGRLGQGPDDVIRAMREGAQTLQEIIDATGRAYEVVHKLLKVLVARGRVRMHTEPSDKTMTRSGHPYGDKTRPIASYVMQSNVEVNHYTLCAREDLTRYEATC